MPFSPQAKLLIALACGNRCVLCPKTLAYETAEGDVAHRGEAAHIAGEKPNSARYDSTMTDAQRNDPKNGIYLCFDCHNEIDNINPGKYSTAALQEKKKEHERLVVESVSAAFGTVTFKELHEVCNRLLKSPEPSPPIDYDLLDLDKKIKLNDFSAVVRNYITMGLSLNAEVQKFIEAEDAINPRFGERLREGFLTEYHKQRYNGIQGDALYESLIALAGRLSTEQHAAVIAVLAYLFEKCEIFEKT